MMICKISSIICIIGIIAGFCDANPRPDDASNYYDSNEANAELTRVKKTPLPNIFTCPASTLLFKGRDDMTFTLYHKNTPVHGVDISKTLGEGEMIPNTPIKFLIHGFLNSANSLMEQVIKRAYLEREEDYNVITVDWSKGSGRGLLNYYDCLITSRNVPLVGKGVAEFIKDLIEKQNVNILYINVIGHSLGAQIAGRTGKNLIQMGYKLPIIVGLDPALPEFKYSNETLRLAPTDAEYVEVIHTNPNDLGFLNPIGTADFYPNWDSEKFGNQPGCHLENACSHARSFQYFAESVKNPYAFEAVKCESLIDLKNGYCGLKGSDVRVYMGGADMRQGKSAGIFFLETRSDPPFGTSKHND